MFLKPLVTFLFFLKLSKLQSTNQNEYPNLVLKTEVLTSLQKYETIYEIKPQLGSLDGESSENLNVLDLPGKPEQGSEQSPHSIEIFKKWVATVAQSSAVGMIHAHYNFSWFNPESNSDDHPNDYSVKTTVKTTIRNSQQEFKTHTTYKVTSQPNHQETEPNSAKCDPMPFSPGPSRKTETTSQSIEKRDVSKFERDCLKAHNRYRANHGSPPLQLNEKLTAYATEWAKYLAKNNLFQHRTNPKYGENLFMAMGQDVSCDYVVKSWYDEIASYSFSNGNFQPNTGHFTQVVWKSSKKIGVGIEKKGTSTWVVANYDPPGNFLGQFQQNVLPLKQ